MPQGRPSSKRTKTSPENSHIPALRTRITKAPTGPGIYQWKDAEGAVLYVGKAKNLKNRLRSYMNAKDAVGPWKQSFLRQIADFEITVTNTELEALILETNLIKRLRPKYNVLMKDDKNYIYARVSVADPYPIVSAVRRIDPKDGAKYFGPMASGGELWETLAMLRKIFPFRTCRMEIVPKGQIGQEGKIGQIALEVECFHKDRPTPCLDHHIGKCTAPCVGLRTPKQYWDESIEGVLRFLKGDYDYVKGVLDVKMQQASKEKKFELAAQLRDHLHSLDRVREKQIITDTSGEDADVLAVAILSGRADVCLLQRRDGRVIGDSCFSLAGSASSAAEVLEQFIPQYYADGIDIPDMLLVSEELGDAKVLEKWLSGLRGKKVRVLQPERGRKSRLLQLAEKNAVEKARMREIKWEAEEGNAENALAQLQEILSLPSLPQRIECFDISHLGGTETVGSMSVALGGKAANDHYRSFTIRTMKDGEVDDYRALTEVLSRRIRRLVEDLPAEEERWKENGVTFGKALKVQQDRILELIRANSRDLSDDNIDYRTFFVARHENEVIAMCRLFRHPNGLLELRSVCVMEEMRGGKLGQFLVRKLLRTVKKGKVYITIDPQLEGYYAAIGFRYLLKAPPVLQDKIDQCARESPDLPPGLPMVYDAAQNKPDPSLSARPDLLVIDGGKGQLGAVAAVLKKFGVAIPVVALAKREEEIFIPDRSGPVSFPPDSPAKFLLMRLRDEAHRFANRHREKRGKKRAIRSALDDVPGIGEEAKTKLLKRFGSVAGIRSASDAELRETVGPMLAEQLRREL